MPLQEAICNYNKTQVSPYDPTKLSILSILRPEDDLISICGQNFKKTVSLDDSVHFTDEDNIVTYVGFDCGINFYRETPTIFGQIIRERNYICSSCESPKCNPSNDHHMCSVYRQHTCKIILNPYNLWDMVPAALMSLNHFYDRDPLSNQKHQPTTHKLEQTQIQSSLHCERWTVRGKDCASALNSFKTNYLPDGRVDETVATVEELNDLWKPGELDGIPPFVMKCNCIWV